MGGWQSAFCRMRLLLPRVQSVIIKARKLTGLCGMRITCAFGGDEKVAFSFYRLDLFEQEFKLIQLMKNCTFICTGSARLSPVRRV